MKKVIVSNKNIGETPLQALERVRKEEGISAKVPMTYAGRLDPMAEGVLIILTGEECKKKTEYLVMDKVYEIEVLLGVKTDTQDVLGMINGLNLEKIETDVQKFVGKFDQSYPRYSSKVIAMKEVPEEMPIKQVEIYSIDELSEREMLGVEIAGDSIEKILNVDGEFRQEEIIEEWKAFAVEFENANFKIVRLRVKCSSGTYMRTLAEKMGGLAYSIKRVSVGEFKN